MKKETGLIILSLFLVLISMSATFAGDNATIDDTLNVDEVSEEEISADPEVGTFDDLSELIHGDDDVIELKQNYKYSPTDNVAKGGITINRSMTINGNGHTIDASDSVRIFIVNASNVVLNNISFINGNASSGVAGAIGANYVENFTINYCNFSNNYADTSGGAVLSYATNTQINNCNFDNNYAKRYGGAVSVRGEHSIIDNSNFTLNYAGYYNMGYGGAVYVGSKYVLVNNTVFDSNGALASGGALYVVETNFKVNNTLFFNNSATFGGSVFAYCSDYFTIDNSTFDSNSAVNYAGAVYFRYGYYPTVKNTRFISNNVTKGTGGAIYSDANYDVYENVTFEKNEAYLAGGALALIEVPNPKVRGCYFDSNSAVHHGGGIYTDSYGCDIYNSTFINGYAASGAGVYMVRYESNTKSNSNAHIRSSKFINNTARYGGAGVSATSHSTISDSEFTGNRAGNYGGAVDLTDARMVNCTLKDNQAIFGGAIYIHESDVINSTFRDNVADVGNAIYILNSSNLEGNDVAEGDVFLYDDDFPGKVVNNNHNITSLMTTDKGYLGYCSERYNLVPYTGVYDTSLEKLKNSVNHQPVADYLKILIYYYIDEFEDLRNYDFSNLVWSFTDYEYWNSTNPVVQEVIKLYDSGLRVSTENGCKVLANGTLMYFNFTSLVTPSGQQNLFLFKFWQEDVLNETLTKEALINRTIYLGDTVEYRIVVNNKGSSPVYDNWVEDKDYSEGLVYKTWRAELGNWTYNEETGRWSLDVLEPGKSASIILTFGVTLDGLMYNNAISGLGVVNVTESGAGFTAYKKNLTVEKKTVTPKVNLSDEVIFDIVVTNTGDVDLDNVFVCESEYDSGLVYLDYISKEGTWKHSLNEKGKHVFTLTELLEIDSSASFRVIFNTTKSGNFSNTVIAGYNDTTLSNSTNVTEVINNTVPENQTNGTDETNGTNETNETNKTSVTIDFKSDLKVKVYKMKDVEKEVDKPKTDDKATGNPLMLLILALMYIPFRRFRR